MGFARGGTRERARPGDERLNIHRASAAQIAGESDETYASRGRGTRDFSVFSRASLLSKYVLFWLLYMR